MALKPASNWHDERVFVVGVDSFADLKPVRAGSEPSSFFVLEDDARQCRVRNFLLHKTPQREFYCDVTLIRKEGESFTPRLRFWIRDTSKKGMAVAEEQLDGVSEITQFAKASVDTSDCHSNLWILLGWLRTFREIETPEVAFRVVENEQAQFLELLAQLGKADVVLDGISATFGASLTDQDISRLTNRKKQLGSFKALLTDDEFFESYKSELGVRGKEGVWQSFFENNKWIFGYGLQLVTADTIGEAKLERTTSGADIFTGGGKRADIVMRTRGFISTLLFGEIKHHGTDLLELKQYRGQDVWVPSHELSGGIAQVQKTTEKAMRKMERSLHRYEMPDGTPTDIEFSSTRPRKVLLIGNLSEFNTTNGTNREKLDTFELFRSSVADVDVVTFDELFHRASFIIEG